MIYHGLEIQECVYEMTEIWSPYGDTRLVSALFAGHMSPYIIPNTFLATTSVGNRRTLLPKSSYLESPAYYWYN